ncbi:EAL domain-containing protein [Oxalobacteraceae bacterium]|nr:EAL domain-containing protein [Oxalobacteraceae bacterium]
MTVASAFSLEQFPRSKAYLRFRRRLVSGLLAMAVLAIAVFAVQFHAAYQERDKATRLQTEHYAKAMEAHVLNTIRYVDLSLLGYANAIKLLPEQNNTEQAPIASLLSSRGTTFSRDFWITFIDASGKAVASSNDLPVNGVNYADRDYFSVHQQASAASVLFVAPPSIGRVSKQKLFFLSRRVENSKGEFIGVVVAPLDATRFSMVFDQSRFSPDVSIGLVHRNGKVIARAPNFEESFNFDLSQTPLFDNLAKGNSGTFATTSAIDKLPRVFSFRVLEKLPLIVVVGTSDEVATRAMVNNFLIAGAGLVLLLGLMLAGGFYALRSYAKLEERELRYRQLYAASRITEEKLSVSEKRLRLVTDNMPVVIAYIDKDLTYQFCNHRFDVVFDIPAKTGPGRKVVDVIGMDIYEVSRPHLEEAFAGKTVYFERLVHGPRGERWDGVSYVPDKNANGDVVGLFLMIEDLNQRKKDEESMKLAALMYQNSAEGMMVTDVDGLILSVNAAFYTICGYTEAEVLGHYAYELTSGKQDAQFFSAMRHAIIDTGHWEGEIWHQNKNGGHYLASLRFDTVYNDKGEAERLVALFSDITKRKATEELIWKQANFDALTGLSNRRKFNEHLRLEMRKTDRSHLPMALVFIDLDHFKEINDTLGHDKGDLLLKEVARRLSQSVRGTDIVSRLGGDEFTVILSELKIPGDAVRMAQEILRKMSAPFMLNDDIAHISASIGITLYPDDGDDAETLIKNADQAMYSAKQQGRNRFNYFAPFMQEASRVRQKLGNELRDAVDKNELRLLFQPIIDLSTGAICKAEALVRWEHPERGLLNPADFIGIAEHGGMIVSIGDWVFREAAREAKRLQQMALPDFQVCVNNSSWQFRDDGSNFEEWLQFLDDVKLSPNSIVIEVTENLLLDPAAGVSDKLQAFRRANMQVSLDDFGTGYCSLAFLKHYDISYLKIDPTLVSNLAPGTDSIALCGAIIAMAHKLNIKVIAEGIETQQQMQALQAAGCDFGQGYLFSYPISGAELEKNIKHGFQAVDN